MRIALGVEYDGRAFRGWQRQLGARTVQEQLEAALTRIADETISVVCAGRTDSGVHARHQTVHFDTTAARKKRSWVLGTNALLPNDVSILWACPVAEQFHARFSAMSRAYEYLILNRQTRPGLWQGKIAWECRPLNVAAMHAAAQSWLGEHDFSSFRAKDCQALHPVRSVYRFDVSECDGIVTLSVVANAFLQHMIRNFAGVLIDIGVGRKSVAWAAEVLALRHREHGGKTASPAGLYLTDVAYPTAFALPRPRPVESRLSCYTGRSFDD